jgi:hypothetical protein
MFEADVQKMVSQNHRQMLSFFMMMKIPFAVKLLNTPISFKANSSGIIIEMSRKYDVKSFFGFFAIWQL